MCTCICLDTLLHSFIAYYNIFVNLAVYEISNSHICAKIVPGEHYWLLVVVDELIWLQRAEVPSKCIILLMTILYNVKILINDYIRNFTIKQFSINHTNVVVKSTVNHIYDQNNYCGSMDLTFNNKVWPLPRFAAPKHPVHK